MQELDKQLIKAIDRDDRSSIESLIEAGIDPNDTLSGWNQTPLTRACADNRRHAVEALVGRGADVNQPAVRGVLPLHEALSRGSVEIAVLLLDAGADPHAPGEYGKGSGHAACRGGLDHVLERLLAAGVDPEALDSGRDSALHVAASGQNPRCVELLLEAGVSPNQRNTRGETPAWLAFKNPAEAVYRAIFESTVAVDLQPYEGRSAYHGFMWETVRPTGDLPMFLRRTGLDINTLVGGQSLWTTALSHAEPRRLIEIMERPGVDPTQTRSDGFSLGHYAARHDAHDLFLHAVERGVDPVGETTDGLAPFQYLVGKPERGRLWTLLQHRGWASFRSARRPPQRVRWRVEGNGPHWYFKLRCVEKLPPGAHASDYEPSSYSAVTTIMQRPGVLDIIGFWGGEDLPVEQERAAIEQMYRQFAQVEPKWTIDYGGDGYPPGVIATGTTWETLWLYLGYSPDAG